MSEDFEECLGIETPESRAMQSLFDKQYNDLYKRLSLYYQACLKNSDKATAYLAERGIDLETAERYNLGYAPDDNRQLLTKLRECGYRPEDLTILGVTTEHGYATFRNRIMFPIIDFTDEVLGFGSRFIGTHAEAKSLGIPKYLNTKDNPKFKKYKTFYTGSRENRDRLYLGEYIFVEGYMDVIKVCEAFRELGSTRCVMSPMSSQLTNGHVEVMRGLQITLMTYTGTSNIRDIVVCFDNDSSGRSGSKKSCELLCELPEMFGVNIRYLPLPEGKDPDEFLTLRDPYFFDALVQTATSLTEYRIITLLNSPLPADKSLEDARLERVRECTRILGECKSAPIRYNHDNITTKLIKQIAHYWLGNNSRGALAAEQSILKETVAIRKRSQR